MANVSRRDFLKLAGVGLGTLVPNPFAPQMDAQAAFDLTLFDSAEKFPDPDPKPMPNFMFDNLVKATNASPIVSMSLSSTMNEADKKVVPVVEDSLTRIAKYLFLGNAYIPTAENMNTVVRREMKSNKNGLDSLYKLGTRDVFYRIPFGLLDPSNTYAWQISPLTLDAMRILGMSVIIEFTLPVKDCFGREYDRMIVGAPEGWVKQFGTTAMNAMRVSETSTWTGCTRFPKLTFDRQFANNKIRGIAMVFDDPTTANASQLSFVSSNLVDPVEAKRVLYFSDCAL